MNSQVTRLEFAALWAFIAEPLLCHGFSLCSRPFDMLRIVGSRPHFAARPFLAYHFSKGPSTMLPLLLAGAAETVRTNKLRHSTALPHMPLVQLLLLVCALLGAWLLARSWWRARKAQTVAAPEYVHRYCRTDI